METERQMDFGRIKEDSDNLLLDRAHQTFELRRHADI